MPAKTFYAVIVGEILLILNNELILKSLTFDCRYLYLGKKKHNLRHWENPDIWGPVIMKNLKIGWNKKKKVISRPGQITFFK